MAISSRTPVRENPNDSFPLLMEQPENHENHEHVIDIERCSDASPTSSSHSASPHGVNPHHEHRPSTNAEVATTQSPSSSLHGSNPRRSSLLRRGEERGRHHWSPFNTLLWISIELVFTIGEIVAAVIVLSLPRDEHPKTPLFSWIVGYTVGCAASLPILYWWYLHRNQSTEQGSSQSLQGSRGNAMSEPNSYIAISLTRSSEEEDGQNASAGTRNSQNDGAPNARLNVLVDHFKMALDCFFAVWFVVGNVWIFGGHSSAAADAPNLYRLCIVFLTFSCIGYAMPFILCAMICCCLPCIVSMLGVHGDMNGTRGASEESINALPTHKFKLKGYGSSSSRDSNASMDESGIVAAGTEKERVISGEDAVCCICLSRYEDNEELRELPCSHFFHMECVDKWLKINASCPLCKFEIVESSKDMPSAADADQQG